MADAMFLEIPWYIWAAAALCELVFILLVAREYRRLGRPMKHLIFSVPKSELRKIIPDLPDDFILHSVWLAAPNQDEIQVLIKSESFPDVPDGKPIPHARAFSGQNN